MSTNYRGGDPGYVAGSITSVAGAEAARSPAKFIERRFARELLLSMREPSLNERGLANFQLRERAGLLPHQNETPRTRSLVLRGLAHDSGLRRENPITKQDQTVWFPDEAKIRAAYPNILEAPQ